MENELATALLSLKTFPALSINSILSVPAPAATPSRRRKMHTAYCCDEESVAVVPVELLNSCRNSTFVTPSPTIFRAATPL